MCNRNFGNDVSDTIDKLYGGVVKPQHGASSRGGCMAAVYDGALSALYGATYTKELRRSVYKEAQKIDRGNGQPEGSSNTIDLVFESLRKDGRADDAWAFRYKEQKWQCESPAKFSGQSVEEAIARSLLGEPHGWYFFGVSVSAGYHSVVLAVHHQSTGRKVFWLDQFATGCKNSRRGGYATASGDVTGKVGQVLAKVGTKRTKLWPLCAKGQVSASQWPTVRVA
jgi:hypothetical protein